MMRALYGRRILPVLIFLTIPVYASIIRQSHGLIESTIRVRISEGSSVVLVRGIDLRIYSADGARKLASVSDRHSEWELRCQDGRIRARRAEGEGVGQSTLDLAEPVVIQSPAGFLQYKGKPYREELRI